MSELNIQDIRRKYPRHSLDVKDVDPDPFKQFQIWFQEAIESKVPEPNAMNLATVGADGKPNSRVVLLKDFGADYFSFYTNHESNKGKEIEANPNISVNFFWIELERQVRIDGIAEKLSREEAEKYFQVRPYMSKIGAHASNQSEVVESRDYLDKKFKSLLEKFPEGEDVPMPDYWGGYKVTPNFFEFWQGRRSRLHDRITYTLHDSNWDIKRLSP